MINEAIVQGDNFGLLHGWVDFDLGVPPWCPAALPVLPDFHLSKQTVQQPKQNQPNQVTNQSCHPVVSTQQHG